MIRPTKNTGYYVSTLHEIDTCGENQSRDNDLLGKEIGAWKYAMEQAIVWTDTAANYEKVFISMVTEEQFKGIWSDLLNNLQLTAVSKSGGNL